VRVLTTLPAALLERVATALPFVDVGSVPSDAPPPHDLRADVLLNPPWDPGHLDALLATGVRWIHTVGTGVDRIPLDRIGDRTLTCSRGASGIPIAEWVMAALLAYAKDLPGIWLTAPPDASRPAMPRLGGLHGARLGLVGLGGIGAAVARHALSFGMRVDAFRRSGGASGIPGVEVVASLDEIFGRCDAVVLALPLTPATRHILASRVLACIPAERGLHLVNVSRGGLVDQEALRPALDDGRIGRATLDVTEPEPLPAGHWLYAHPRARISAHVSWSAPGAFDLLLDTFIENLQRHRAGESLGGLVDRAAGY
jgi:phosphoglycerate dehydrogenase-like enzyme